MSFADELAAILSPVGCVRPRADASLTRKSLLNTDINPMQTSVDFESNLFIPFLPDEAQVNPTVYGAELAFWLSRQLAQRGMPTSYPQCEDGAGSSSTGLKTTTNTGCVVPTGKVYRTSGGVTLSRKQKVCSDVTRPQPNVRNRCWTHYAMY